MNEWVFSCGNATWDNPRNLAFMDEMFERRIEVVLRRHLRGPKRRGFLGMRRSFSYRDIEALDFPWGWKDPRNTFTIRIWRRIFPECKVLHIYRNPLDVAESLRVARERHMMRGRSRFRDGVNEALLRRVPYQISLRIRDVHEGLRLWGEYVDAALALRELFQGKMLDIRYETLLEEPKRILTELTEFLALEVPERQIQQAASELNAARAFAFARNPELLDIYMEIKGSIRISQRI